MSDDIKSRIIHLSKQGLTANHIFTVLRHEFPSESYRAITAAIDDYLSTGRVLASFAYFTGFKDSAMRAFSSRFLLYFADSLIIFSIGMGMPATANPPNESIATINADVVFE